MAIQHKYKAFVTYSHIDNRDGDKLFKALEKYKVPKRLIGTETSIGPVPKRLGQFFQDRAELSAADDLTVEIKQAIENSEFMIVICSPNAAASRWVNKEILEFKRLKGEKNILSIIIDGEPFADGDNQANECFPPALRFKLDKDGKLSKQHAMPAAADARKIGDGWSRAFLKVAAGLIGVGLDRLIERELQRKIRNVMAVTAVTMSVMLLTITLAYQAMIARDEANLFRGKAEGLIEFMLTDLRAKLEPVGRLDVLDAVGTRVVTYYDNQKLDQVSDDSLGRRAKAHHMLGVIKKDQGQYSNAKEMFEEALAATQQLMKRDPANPDRIYEHAQSVFYTGNIKREAGDIEGAYDDFSLYSMLSAILVRQNPNDVEAIREAAYAESNLGALLLWNMDKPKEAFINFENANNGFLAVIANEGETESNVFDLANGYAWIADAQLPFAHVDEILETHQKELSIYKPVLSQENKNHKILKASLGVKRRMSNLQLLTGHPLKAIHEQQIAQDQYDSLLTHDPENVKWRERSIYSQLQLAHAYSVQGDYEKLRYVVEATDIALENLPDLRMKSFLKKVRQDYPLQLLKAQLAYAEGKYSLAQSIANALMKSLEGDYEKDHSSPHATYMMAAARLLDIATIAHNGEAKKAQKMLDISLLILLNGEAHRLPKTDMLLLQYYRLLGRDILANQIEKSLMNRGYKPFDFIKFPPLHLQPY